MQPHIWTVLAISCVAGDYASEASKMLLIGSNFAPQAANRIRENASENLENLAARTAGPGIPVGGILILMNRP
ncbi:hypothetical protein FHT76_008062 [Rhizobium sp. BK176]|nr:hypothetical protein [Rhizobium sp. BK176]